MTTVTDNTKDLNDALDDMRGKTKTLNDGMKSLAGEGFDKLTATVLRATNMARNGTKQNSGDIVSDHAMKFAKNEMSSLLRDIMGAKQGASAPANIVINNNAGASVTARETSGPFDQKYLEITIDQMVAQSLMRGRQTSGVLRTLFGLAPGLSGR